MTRGNGAARGRTLPKILSDEQMQLLFDQVNIGNPTGIRNMVALELMGWSGLRVSEVSAMRRRDIDFTGKKLRVLGKGDKERIVGLRDRTLEWMRNWDELRRPRATTFLHTIKGDAGKPCSRSSMLKMVKRYAGQAGLDSAPVNCHMLRHTAATRLVRRGMSPVTLQEQLGHEDIGTTMIYTHLEPQDRVDEFRKLTNEQGSLDDAPAAEDLLLMALLREIPAERKRALIEGMIDTQD